MPTFTVKAAMPTGKTDPKFGTEFYVQFNEMADTAKLWFKDAPEVGKSLELEKGQYGWKKVKKEWNGSSASSADSSPASSSPASSTSSRPSYEDNRDGMRQGMCINNAANYVNALSFDNALTDHEWAQTVFSYATALYALGDLKAQEADKVTDLYAS
jgi:hypothetical protein